MKKVVRLSESELMKIVKRVIREFEEMERPSMFDRLKRNLTKKGKEFIGYEKKDDRETLEHLHKIIGLNHSMDTVSNVREIEPGVIVAWIMNKSLTVDKNDHTIMYKGKELDVNNIELECESLYDELKRLED